MTVENKRRTDAEYSESQKTMEWEDDIKSILMCI